MGMSLFDGHRPASSKKFFSLLVELIPRLVKNGKMGGQDGYAKTIKRHWSGVLRWYKIRINNGILEGLNSLFQAAKAKARGYRTFKNLKTMIYMLTGKLDYSKVGLPT